MKTFKHIFFLMFFAVTLLSCEDDGGDSNRNLTAGAVPDVQKAANTASYIDLDALQNGNDISITFSVGVGIENDRDNIQSMRVVGFYITADGEIEKATLQENVTSFPTSITLTNQNLIDRFNLLNGAGDFNLGDQFIVTAEITLANGTVLQVLTDDANQNYSPYIDPSQARYSVYQIYNVSCPSDLGGTYNFVSTNAGVAGSGSLPGPFTGTVTFTDNGGGSYAISDASFGGFLAIYGASDPVAAGVTLTDICGLLSFGGSDQYGETYSFANFVNNGTSISFDWSNTYGEFGSTTLTRTDGSSWPDNLRAE